MDAADGMTLSGEEMLARAAPCGQPRRLGMEGGKLGRSQQGDPQAIDRPVDISYFHWEHDRTLVFIGHFKILACLIMVALPLSIARR